MSKFRIYFLTFTLILFSSNSAWATPLLTAQCGVLQGVKLVEGEEKPNISPESHSGNPVLIVDSENPKKLISLWKSKLFDKETVDTYQASIVELSPSRLQAVEHDEYGHPSWDADNHLKMSHKRHRKSKTFIFLLLLITNAFIPRSAERSLKLPTQRW